MPKVSILVPIYNVEKYLRECLDSLVNQTLQDIEIICINDGSTDNSPQIIEEYRLKDNRIRVINKENSGYGASMNMGLALAQGEYIGIVESDDFAKTTMFEELYKTAIKNDLDIVKSDFYAYTTENNQACHTGKMHKFKTNKVFSIKDNPKVLTLIPSIWSAIYKRSFLENNNIKFLETPGASYQDVSFAFKTLSAADRIMFSSKAYIYYRQDNETSSVKSKSKVYAISEEFAEITKFLNENPNIKTIVNNIKLSTQFEKYKWNAKRIDESFRDEFIDKFQKDFQTFSETGELQKEFYELINQEEITMLLNNKGEFRAYIDKLAEKEAQKRAKRKLFSIRINSARVSIILFGKQIVGI